MSLKLYKINTTLNHPDCMAGFKKNDDEIFSFFKNNPDKLDMEYRNILVRVIVAESESSREMKKK